MWHAAHIALCASSTLNHQHLLHLQYYRQTARNARQHTSWLRNVSVETTPHTHCHACNGLQSERHMNGNPHKLSFSQILTQIRDIKSWVSNVEEAASEGMCHTYLDLLCLPRTVWIQPALKEIPGLLSTFLSSSSTLFYWKLWQTASCYLTKSPTEFQMSRGNSCLESIYTHSNSFVPFLEEDSCFQWKGFWIKCQELNLSHG